MSLLTFAIVVREGMFVLIEADDIRFVFIVELRIMATWRKDIAEPFFGF